MVGDWKRVTRGMRCTLCKHDSWCLIHKDGNAVICPRTLDGHYKDLGEAGYLHFLDGRQPIDRFELPRWEPKVPAREITKPPDWQPIIAEYQTRATAESKRMAATMLGVTVESLERLDFGLTQKNAWSFVMSDFAGEPVGIRIRTSQGKKWAYPGSRNGLFFPKSLTGIDPLIICEGPTDTAAALDLGFDAIGRPNCNGALEWCLDVSKGRALAIFADNDGPGLDGANKLAEWAVRQCKSVKVAVAPYRKDLREWKREGATRAGVKAVIDATPHWKAES